MQYLLTNLDKFAATSASPDDFKACAHAADSLLVLLELDEAKDHSLFRPTEAAALALTGSALMIAMQRMIHHPDALETLLRRVL
jgi:hypothetical protein